MSTLLDIPQRIEDAFDFKYVFQLRNKISITFPSNVQALGIIARHEIKPKIDIIPLLC